VPPRSNLRQSVVLLKEAGWEVKNGVLTNVQNGSFAKEWAAEQTTGYKNFEAMQKELRDSLFGQAEREVMQELKEATK